MLYDFKNVVVKSNDWKIASIKGADGVVAHEVSVNRSNKKGEVFPRFDDIADGAQLEGNLWTNDAGKNYLFAPRGTSPRKNGGGNRTGPADIEKAQDHKAEHIKVAMDNKEYAIKVASTFSSATAIVVELMKEDKLTEWHTLHHQVRQKLWEMYDIEKPEGDIF